MIIITIIQVLDYFYKMTTHVKLQNMYCMCDEYSRSMYYDYDHDHDHDLIFTFICVRTAAAVFLYIVIARTAVNLY